MLKKAIPEMRAETRGMPWRLEGRRERPNERMVLCPGQIFQDFYQTFLVN